MVQKICVPGEVERTDSRDVKAVKLPGWETSWMRKKFRIIILVAE